MADWTGPQQRLLALGCQRLANAWATIDGQRYAGLYEARSAVALGYGSGSSPTFTCATSLPENTAILLHDAAGQPLFQGRVVQVDPDNGAFRARLQRG